MSHIRTSSLLLVPFALLFFIGGMLVPNAIDEDLHPCMSILSHNNFSETFNPNVHQFARTPDGHMLYNHNLEMGHSCHEHFKLHFDDINNPGRRLQYDKTSNFGEGVQFKGCNVAGRNRQGESRRRGNYKRWKQSMTKAKCIPVNDKSKNASCQWRMGAHAYIL